MLDAFASVLVAGEEKRTLTDEMTELFKQASIEEIPKLAAAIEHGTKEACGMSSESGWLEQYEGTPLYDQAVALEEESLNLEAERIQRRIAEAEQRDDTYEKQDMVRLKKRMLDLDLNKLRIQGSAGGASEEEEEEEEPEEVMETPDSKEAEAKTPYEAQSLRELLSTTEGRLGAAGGLGGGGLGLGAGALAGKAIGQRLGAPGAGAFLGGASGYLAGSTLGAEGGRALAKKLETKKEANAQAASGIRRVGQLLTGSRAKALEGRVGSVSAPLKNVYKNSLANEAAAVSSARKKALLGAGALAAGGGAAAAAAKGDGEKAASVTHVDLAGRALAHAFYKTAAEEGADDPRGHHLRRAMLSLPISAAMEAQPGSGTAAFKEGLIHETKGGLKGGLIGGTAGAGLGSLAALASRKVPVGMGALIGGGLGAQVGGLAGVMKARHGEEGSEIHGKYAAALRKEAAFPLALAGGLALRAALPTAARAVGSRIAGSALGRGAASLGSKALAGIKANPLSTALTGASLVPLGGAKKAVT